MKDLEARLAATFHRELDGVETPQLDPVRLGRARRKGWLLAATASVAVLALVSGAVALTARTIDGADVRPAPADRPPSDEVVVRCTAEGTTVTTPEVLPSENGIEIRVENETDKREIYMLSTEGSGNELGSIAAHGVTRFPSYAPPRTWAIGCFDGSASIPYDDPTHPDYDTFEVIDSRGIWTPRELECEQQKFLTMESRIETGTEPDLEVLAREHVTGLRPDDELARPGYPREQLMWETRVVMREGKVVASIGFLGSPARLLVDACDDSGIRLSKRSGSERYALLARDDETSVYGPRESMFEGCPEKGPDLTTTDLPEAEHAVLLAAQQLSEGLDARDAYATSTLAADDGHVPDFAAMIAKDCNGSLVPATALVTLHLPKAESASLGATTYFVSKMSGGWVVWNAW